MTGYQRLLSLAACLLLSMFAMLNLTPKASAQGAPGLTVTGALHVTETNAVGDVMNYTITDVNGTVTTIHVQPPNSGATTDIKSHEGKKVTAKYHLNGETKVHDGFLT